MKRAALSLVVLLVLVAGVRAQKNIDQILVLVNDDPITRTDLLWSLAMDAKAPNPAAAVSSDVLRRKLDVMIDERLISQEASRIPSLAKGRFRLERRNQIRSRRSSLKRPFASEWVR